MSLTNAVRAATAIIHGKAEVHPPCPTHTPHQYDCMIGPLLRMLFDGADQSRVLDWIRTERVSHFGLSVQQP